MRDRRRCVRTLQNDIRRFVKIVSGCRNTRLMASSNNVRHHFFDNMTSMVGFVERNMWTSSQFTKLNRSNPWWYFSVLSNVDEEI